MEDIRLASAIKNLELLAQKLKEQEEFDLKLMIEATEKSHRLIERLHDIAIHTRNKELEDFFNQVLLNIAQLNQIAHAELTNAPQPPQMLSAFSSAFEKFLDTCLSKRNQKNLSNLASHIPFIDNVVYTCETMPYYWHYANRQEKVAMVLSVVLSAAVVALAITAIASPAIAALPILSGAILACMNVAKSLFNAVIGNPKNKYDDLQKVKELKDRLDQQETMMEDQIKTIFPEQRRNMLTAAKSQAFVDELPAIKPVREKGFTKSTVHPIDQSAKASGKENLSAQPRTGVKNLRSAFEKGKPSVTAKPKIEPTRSVKDLSKMFEDSSKINIKPSSWKAAQW